MGRFAQAKRRGGGPSPSPLPLVDIISVTVVAADAVYVLFDKPIGVFTTPAPGDFTVADQDVLRIDHRDPANPAAIYLQITGPVAAGDDWALNVGTWTSPPAIAPSAGLCV